LLISSSVPEPPTKVIAQNNALAASTKLENPYEIQRRLEAVPKLAQNERLFEYQANALRRNHYALDLQSQKYKGVAASTSNFLSKQTLPTLSPTVNAISVINAAAHAQSQVSKSSIKVLLSLFEKRPNDIGLLLTIIQLYVLTNNFISATTLLESFFSRLEASSDHETRFAPGLVALSTSLYRSANRKGPLRAELKKAAAYWQDKAECDDRLLRAAGTELLESEKEEDWVAAGQIFENLKKKNPNDRIAAAGLVASRAATSLSSLGSETNNLTPIDQLVGGIDVDALLSAGIATRPQNAIPSNKKRAATGDVEMKDAEAKKRKIRKNKMPQDFVEGKAMDPERWLPARDRSSYKPPKGKKGKKKANDLTQGGMVRDEEEEKTQVVKAAASGGGKKKKGKGKK
jgi:signal recognition particle subunit SRP72